MSVKVYLDVLFLINFIINTSIIYIASLLLCRKIHTFRLLSAGTLLALYSCAMFFPDFSFLLTIISKTLILSFCTFIAFPSKALKQITKNTLTVFLTYGICGGVMYALIFLTDFGYKTGAAISNGEFYLNLSTTSLFIGFSVCIIFSLIFLKIFRQSRIKDAQLFNVRLIHSGKAEAFKVFGDTGCSITDCTNSVMIIDNKTANKLLPSDFFLKEENCDKWRIIPYSTISQKSGVLMGFVPDEIYINNTLHKNITVAISKKLLTPNGEYNGLINPTIICERNDLNAEPAVT